MLNRDLILEYDCAYLGWAWQDGANTGDWESPVIVESPLAPIQIESDFDTVSDLGIMPMWLTLQLLDEGEI